MEADMILELRQVQQHFKVSKDLTVKAVDGLDLTLRRGEVFGLVGESGCGKSTVARMIAGIYKPTAGEIFFAGKSMAESRAVRQQIQLIFQDSAAALNPRMQVADIIMEPLRIHGRDYKSEEARQKLLQMMEQVGLAAGYLEKLPGELSGGQRQRVAIARSLMLKPALLVADEPVASLDISIQAQIIALFQQLQQENAFSLLFIAHDLLVVRYISDRVGVMLQGKMVELAPTEELFNNPEHPYTKSLLSAIPVPDPLYERQKKILYYDTSQPLGDKMVEVRAEHWVREGQDCNLTN